jgi:hypothetical protein
MDAARLEETKIAFQEVLTRGQIKYHEVISQRLRKVDHRLHAVGTGLFVSTFVACVFHLALKFGDYSVPPWTAMLLIILNALLPAIGAALAGIRSQAELQRLVRRSEAMQKALANLQLQLSMITPAANRLKSQEIRGIVERIAQLMLNETLDWRVVFQDRPLTLPT